MSTSLPEGRGSAAQRQGADHSIPTTHWLRRIPTTHWLRRIPTTHWLRRKLQIFGIATPASLGSQRKRLPSSTQQCRGRRPRAAITALLVSGYVTSIGFHDENPLRSWGGLQIGQWSMVGEWPEGQHDRLQWLRENRSATLPTSPTLLTATMLGSAGGAGAPLHEGDSRRGGGRKLDDGWAQKGSLNLFRHDSASACVPHSRRQNHSGGL